MKPAKQIENSPWLRDLHWVMRSPFLMNPAGVEGEEPPAVGGSETPKIECLEHAAEREEYAGRRVGYYFESLVYHWLKVIRQVEILAHGKQIVQHGKTLGELDFVFRDEEGVITHWEVAAKFYLHSSDCKVLDSHYVGPNAGDTFELKRDKIFTKQLPLSAQFFSEIEVRQAFVKGRIFYHLWQGEMPQMQALPAGMCHNHLRGIWLKYSELSQLHRAMASKEVRYHLLAKPRWLSACWFPSGDLSLWDFQVTEEYLQTHFSQKNQPLLLSALSQCGDDWLECERVFVVADGWPEL